VQLTVAACASGPKLDVTPEIVEAGRIGLRQPQSLHLTNRPFTSTASTAATCSAEEYGRRELELLDPSYQRIRRWLISRGTAVCQEALQRYWAIDMIESQAG